MTIEAMKLALEALEAHADIGIKSDKAITALRTAIAEAESVEPVACQYAVDVAMPEYRCVGKCQYTTPPAAQRQPLTDEQIVSVMQSLGWTGKAPSDINFARAIESAHGIGEKT